MRAEDAAIAIRPAAAGDAPALAGVFTEAVHALGAAHFDARQLQAWAPRPPDVAGWAARLSAPDLHVRVALTHTDEVAGFIAWSDDGHIDLLFTHPAQARRGVATALFREAERSLAALGVRALFTEASPIARPVFERWGFVVQEEQRVLRHGVELWRYAMRRP